MLRSCYTGPLALAMTVISLLSWLPTLVDAMNRSALDLNEALGPTLAVCKLFPRSFYALVIDVALSKSS